MSEPVKTGRPTKYDESFCEMLIKHRKEGLSFESFGAVVKVDRETLYEWAKVHPAFSNARKLAEQECLSFWEKAGVRGMNMGKDFNAPVWIFSMKNRFPDLWKDKIETTSSPTTININIDSDDSKL